MKIQSLRIACFSLLFGFSLLHSDGNAADNKNSGSVLDKMIDAASEKMDQVGTKVKVTAGQEILINQSGIDQPGADFIRSGTTDKTERVQLTQEQKDQRKAIVQALKTEGLTPEQKTKLNELYRQVTDDPSKVNKVKTEIENVKQNIQPPTPTETKPPAQSDQPKTTEKPTGYGYHDDQIRKAIEESPDPAPTSGATEPTSDTSGGSPWTKSQLENHKERMDGYIDIQKGKIDRIGNDPNISKQDKQAEIEKLKENIDWARDQKNQDDAIINGMGTPGKESGGGTEPNASMGTELPADMGNIDDELGNEFSNLGNEEASAGAGPSDLTGGPGEMGPGPQPEPYSGGGGGGGCPHGTGCCGG